MNEELRKFKQMIIGSRMFQPKNGGWFRGKNCPYCGDVKYHYYIHIDLEDDSPITQKCFKCNAKGCIDEKMLECYGLEWKGNIPRSKFNNRRINSSNGVYKFEIRDEDIDTVYMNRCVDYIESRLGIDGIGLDELKQCGVILNPKMYSSYILNDDNINMNRCWFMCTNGMLVGRDFVKKKDGWEKFKGNSKIDGRMLYVIKKPFDLYEDINVCICEGVMDAIGLMYHGGIKNGIYIAVLGRDYMAGIEYIIDRGIMGDSVLIHIYKDADVKNVKLDELTCRFFKSVDVYMNTKGKDFGLCADEIEIEKCMGV